jgi:hypothetical protein
MWPPGKAPFNRAVSRRLVLGFLKKDVQPLERAAIQSVSCMPNHADPAPLAQAKQLTPGSAPNPTTMNVAKCCCTQTPQITRVCASYNSNPSIASACSIPDVQVPGRLGK